MTRQSSHREEPPGTKPLGNYRGGAPRFELHVFVGDRVERHALPLTGTVTVGRSHSVEIRIDHDSISRKHALLHVGSVVLVQDLGSQNGTSVGAVPSKPGVNTPVAPGVPFAFGGVSVVVAPLDATASAAPIPAAAPSTPTARAVLRDELAAIERARIVEALAQCGGNQTKAAAMLGISRRTLVSRLAEFGIARPRK